MGRPTNKVGWQSRRNEPEWAKVALAVQLIAGRSYQRVLSKRRDDNTAQLRWVIMYALYREFDLSTTDVGSIFHRDHTTVLYGFKRVEASTHLHQRAILAQALIERNAL